FRSYGSVVEWATSQDEFRTAHWLVVRPRHAPLTQPERAPMVRAENRRGPGVCAAIEAGPMKIRNSLKSLRGRHRDNRIVRRKGRVYIINKTQRRFKARQG